MSEDKPRQNMKKGTYTFSAYLLNFMEYIHETRNRAKMRYALNSVHLSARLFAFYQLAKNSITQKLLGKLHIIPKQTDEHCWDLSVEFANNQVSLSGAKSRQNINMEIGTLPIWSLSLKPHVYTWARLPCNGWSNLNTRISTCTNFELSS